MFNSATTFWGVIGQFTLMLQGSCYNPIIQIVMCLFFKHFWRKKHNAFEQGLQYGYIRGKGTVFE